MTGSSSDRWRRIEELLSAALERDASGRDVFLAAACTGDPELRREVASLLAAHERPGAVDRLAAEMAPLAARVRGSAAPALSQRSHSMVFLRVDPKLARLRADPRFAPLVRRVFPE